MKHTDLIEKHLKKYPEMEFADGLKLSVHASFGAAHYGGDTEKNLTYVKKEFSVFENDPSLFIFEDIGEDYCRLELKHPLVRDLGADTVSKLFHLSASEDKRCENSEKKLALLKGFIEETKSLFSPAPEECAAADRLLDNYTHGICDSISHSKKYNGLYSPSYRVLSKKYGRLFSLIYEICSLLKNKENGVRTVIALDGRCASGKTTAAVILSKLFDAPVIPMDDFFLPFERKTPERLAETGGNVDYERFSAEVFPFLKDTAPFAYKAYDCSKRDHYIKNIPSSDILIVEGVYCMRPEFRTCYDLSAFFCVSPETQISRLEKRNPAFLERFINEWIPMEEDYFKKMNVKALCDVTVSEG